MLLAGFNFRSYGSGGTPTMNAHIET